MQINTSTQQGRVPVTIMQLDGDLDASNYAEVIQKAQELYAGEARHLVIDLSKVSYMSSAGLMAIHTVALIFGGNKMEAKGSGRPAFRAIDLQRDQLARQHVKLLNPQPQVEQVLGVVGLKQFFEIFTDLQGAVNSF